MSREPASRRLGMDGRRGDSAITSPARLTPGYEAIFNAAPGNYLLLDPQFIIVGVTDAYLAATMTVRGEILGRGLFDVFPDNPGDPGADGVRNLRASLMRVLASKRADRMPVQKYDIPRPEHAGGGFEERYWSPLNSPVIRADGEISRIIHSVEDVTEFVRLKRQMREEQDLLQKELSVRSSKIEAEVFLREEAVTANRLLAESERRYRFLADATPQLIWTANPDGSADYFNERWHAFTQVPLDALRGDGWHRSLHPEDVEPTALAWAQAVETQADRFQIEHRLRYHDGSYRWMLTTALPYRDGQRAVVKWFGSTTDIHDRVVADEQLRQIQRFQAVGELAGGVAHDFNNLLTVIRTAAELLLADLEGDDARLADAAAIKDAANRGASLTRQLLAFSRKQVLHLRVMDVNAVVTGLEPMMRRLVEENIAVVTRLATDLDRVKADANQLEQVILNLVVNARDAMPDGGTLLIETSNVVLDEEYPRAHATAQAGPHVVLTVTDTGCGMDAATQARIFEPFFTTKPMGRGTGLGLATVYGIVKQSGGNIWVYSEVGRGTTFKIYFPRYTGADEEVDEAKAHGLPNGREDDPSDATILLVEDDVAVRAAVRRVLERRGYRVLEAPNGAEALAAAAKPAEVIDLVISDMVMPGMSGLELRQHLLVLRPALQVLLMSGYSEEAITRLGGSGPLPSLIEKPFTVDGMLAKVRDLLRSGVPDA